MRLDDVSGDSSRIEDRRGRGGSGGSGFGGGGLPIGKGGGLIGIVVVYGWAMNRFERQDAERKAAQALHDATDRPHG